MQRLRVDWRRGGSHAPKNIEFRYIYQDQSLESAIDTWWGHCQHHRYYHSDLKRRDTSNNAIVDLKNNRRVLFRRCGTRCAASPSPQQRWCWRQFTLNATQASLTCCGILSRLGLKRIHPPAVVSSSRVRLQLHPFMRLAQVQPLVNHTEQTQI